MEQMKNFFNRLSFNFASETVTSVRGLKLRHRSGTLNTSGRHRKFVELA